MTRKDYVLLAEALKRAAFRSCMDAPECIPGVNIAAVEVANALAADNPRFDADRFLRAAGVRT